jgi:hypothetical protein
MNSDIYKGFFLKTSTKLLLIIIFLISVNLLAGYVAVWLKFPSLWGNSQIFLDYAMPFGLTWALAHWPSIILTIIPLLLLPHWNEQQLQLFRLICLSLFFILLYGVHEKIPFALFPAVDFLVAFFFSLIIVPPTYKHNPKLVIGISIFLSFALLSGTYCMYSKWQHRTPEIKESNLMNGLFVLKVINVNSNYKELTFEVELTQMISQENICDTATEMSEALFESYPFDANYKKTTQIIFNPIHPDKNLSPYPLGELNQFEEDGQVHIGCYLKYK